MPAWHAFGTVSYGAEPTQVLVQERVRGDAYDALVDEVVAALRSRYGASLLLHWEDFAAANAFRLLAKYQAQARCSAAIPFVAGAQATRKALQAPPQ